MPAAARLTQVLSRFSKGVDTARAINFGPSGGSSCPSSCQFNVTGNPHWQPADGWCYAMRFEAQRPVLRNKLALLLTMTVALICQRALAELKANRASGVIIDHIRFCSAGSIRPFQTLTKKDQVYLVRLCKWIAAKIQAAWLPIADEIEAGLYRSLIGQWITVRLSADNDRFLTYGGPCSTVAGRNGDLWQTKVAIARDLARKRYLLLGRKTIVCPEIVQAWQSRWGHGRTAAKAHCGSRGNGCDACCNRDLDVVFPKT